MLALANGSLIEMHTPRHWALTFESMGNDAFQQKNRKYSKKLKHQAVQDYLT